jgi:predicted N-formylglutamate amidohydrolase
MGSVRLLLTCEHGGSRIPREYRPLFRTAARDLASHRGWDPGALDVARGLARRLRLPLLAVTWSRLLVEPNRSPTNPRIWSEYTKGLSAEERERILARYWWPHRRDVESAVRSLVARGHRVVHVAVHSFAPVLDGEPREADVGLLYDSGRAAEKALCIRWQGILEKLDPSLRVRRNHPYRGATDGLPTWLRRRFPGRVYAGVELELCQALLTRSDRARVAALLAASLERLLREAGEVPATGSGRRGSRRSTSRR